MRTNHVKAKLKRGEPSFGAWLSMPTVYSARVLSRVGYDWINIDGEHSAQNPTLVGEMVSEIAQAGVSAPLVRLPWNRVEYFKWALDAGAWGVIVPMIESREEAEQAVSWCKYPPQGTRSIGGYFAPLGFGASSRAEYGSAVNDEILVVLQIESAKGLENVEEILSVPGVDVAFIGPNDLHAQLGLPPSNEGNEPEFEAALEKVKAAARRYNVAMGMFSSDGQAAAKRAREGFHMISATSDVQSLLWGANRNLRDTLS
jgi:4-hydroxy-2-oxoheptanedioate aldolase